jgi:hypothetical protein
LGGVQAKDHSEQPPREYWFALLALVWFISLALSFRLADLHGVFVFQEFEMRRQARSKGRVYYDPATLSYQNERIPEQIRLKVSKQLVKNMTIVQAAQWSVISYN